MKSFRFLKERRSLIVPCIVISVTLITGLATTRAGFDFQTAIQDQSSGPALGDTIDLTSFRSRSGQTLAEVIKGHSLAMVVLVNPKCETCAAAKERFNSLKERVAQPRIPYYVLMIPDSSETQSYFSYADSLKLGGESFVWSNTENKAPTSLVNMVVPSHLMITNEGLVVNKWHGDDPK